MDPTRFDLLAQWAGGELTGDPALTTRNICTDSRALHPGDLFLALKGENFDGHAFLAQAAALGAFGAVVEESAEPLPADFPLIRVPDTLHALQEIARSYRAQLPLQVVALTGSNGKTSTKDLTASVLEERFQVTKTKGNFNNHIGLPLSVLQAGAEDQFGVFEIGMNHPGEIAPLAALAAPQIAIITNIGVAHIEFLGSREGIAQEKGALAKALGPEGTLILSAEDDFTPQLAQRTRGRVVLAGFDQGEVQARDLRPGLAGTRFTLCAGQEVVEAELPVPGRHMVANALLAVAAGRVAGLTLGECAAGLRKLRLTKGRLEQKTVGGLHLLDDTYNANPDSMVAALRTLVQMPGAGRRVAVLGAMGELGVESERGHRGVGEAAAHEKLDFLIGVGESARWMTDEARGHGLDHVVQCESVETAARALLDYVQPGDFVLIKGSRSARMERIVEALETV